MKIILKILQNNQEIKLSKPQEFLHLVNMKLEKAVQDSVALISIPLETADDQYKQEEVNLYTLYLQTQLAYVQSSVADIISASSGKK